MRPLPDIRFVWAETRLAGSGQPALRRSLWALKRWRIETVRVIGRAALNEKGRRTLALARARTELIAEQLHAAGLKAEAAWDSPAFQQKNREKAQGQTAWCVVRLQPVFETGGGADGTRGQILNAALTAGENRNASSPTFFLHRGTA
jgi:hypothetical protein